MGLIFSKMRDEDRSRICHPYRAQPIFGDAVLLAPAAGGQCREMSVCDPDVMRYNKRTISGMGHNVLR